MAEVTIVGLDLAKRVFLGVRRPMAALLFDPTAVISDMTVLHCGSSQIHLGIKMSSGGGHIIRAVQRRNHPLGKCRHPQAARRWTCRVYKATAARPAPMAIHQAPA